MDLTAASTRQVAFLAHSLLNPTLRPRTGTAGDGPGPLLGTLRDVACELVQLPAVETRHLGVRRWWPSRTMLDSPGFREHCRQLASPVLRQVEQMRADGYDAVIIGADGSASCGVLSTSDDPAWGGRPRGVEDPARVAGRGVWIDVLDEVFADAGLPFPRTTGFDPQLSGAAMSDEVHRVRTFLRRSLTGSLT